MNRFILAAFLLVSIFSVSEAAVAKKKVKEGETLIIDSLENGQGIERTVAAGKQTFHFNGPEKGAFLDSDWKEVDPSNYQMKSMGVLLIKKFTKADVGLYTEKPKIDSHNPSGSFSAGGLTLDISLE